MGYDLVGRNKGTKRTEHLRDVCHAVPCCLPVPPTPPLFTIGVSTKTTDKHHCSRHRRFILHVYTPPRKKAATDTVSI